MRRRGFVGMKALLLLKAPGLLMEQNGLLKKILQSLCFSTELAGLGTQFRLLRGNLANQIRARLKT